MSLELSFKQVCKFIQKDDSTLIEAVDNLLGLAIVCSPALLGSVGLAVLPLLAAKNEITKIGRNVFNALSRKNDVDFLAREMRMQVAYGLISYTAFFEALDRGLPEGLRQKINLQAAEKLALAQTAVTNTARTVDKAVEDDSQVTLRVVNFVTPPIPFPHPTESVAEQEKRHLLLYQQMAEGFLQFLGKLALWDEAAEENKRPTIEALRTIPTIALGCFESQYFELCRRYEEFAIWANLHEHKNTKQLLSSLSAFVAEYVELSKTQSHTIDIGLSRLQQTVAQIPEILKTSQWTEIVDGLARHYQARIHDPIIEVSEETEDGSPRLSFPRICDAFIPQAFRVLQTSKATHLEDEAIWQPLKRRNDLGAFLFSYLLSPYSTATPLLVLGHPGSGKSLLTTLLSAQLMSKQYTAIRVPLREVNSEAGIVTQIEEQIARVTSVRVDSWAKLSGAFKNNPPLVILDGYDELLQASGKVFSSYLKEVQNFQKNEAEQGRPVRVIVTSRITLIDKAMIPLGSTVIRLLEFDTHQQQLWISI